MIFSPKNCEILSLGLPTFLLSHHFLEEKSFIRSTQCSSYIPSLKLTVCPRKWAETPKRKVVSQPLLVSGAMLVSGYGKIPAILEKTLPRRWFLEGVFLIPWAHAPFQFTSSNEKGVLTKRGLPHFGGPRQVTSLSSDGSRFCCFFVLIYLEELQLRKKGMLSTYSP